MHSTMIVVARLLPLASAFALPRADSLVIKEPVTISGVFFPAGKLPTLRHNGGRDGTSKILSFELKETASFVEYFGRPIIDYYLAPVPDQVYVSLYGLAEQVDGVTVHKVVGPIDNPHDKNPRAGGPHSTTVGQLSDGRQIPDGAYHVGIVATNDKGERDEWLSPVFNVERLSASEN